MLPSPQPNPWPTRFVFVLSAAVAALVLRLAWYEPFAGIVALMAIATMVVGRWLARRRTRRLLRSGDVESIIQRWSTALERVPHANTMGPLMTATAFAAHGWTERARKALEEAERGPAWDAALEHRLFVDTLLLTFEGDVDGAIAQARALERLPLPSAGPQLVDRVRVLRAAVAALARAFSHQSMDGDKQLMLDAGNASPLVHWAMRYGAAILAVDDGDLRAARMLLDGAPMWPGESRFSSFHHEIDAEVARRSGPGLDLPIDGEASDEGAAGPILDEEDRA